MSKIFFTLIYTLVLLFQTTSFAEDNHTEIVVETSAEEVTESVQEQEIEPSENVSEGDATEEQATTQKEEVKKESSEAQKEADAAEAAELREVGEGDEPMAE